MIYKGRCPITEEKIFELVNDQSESKENRIKTIKNYGNYRQGQGEVLERFRRPDYKAVSDVEVDVYCILTDLLKDIRRVKN